MKEQIIEKMYAYYDSFMSYKECEARGNDIEKILSVNKYEKVIKEWLNDSENYSDVVVNGFSLVDIAKKLDSEHPNIPISAYLLYMTENDLYDEVSFYQCILPIANNLAIVDYKLIENNMVCQTAILNDGEWYLFSKEPNSDDLIRCQMWQALILNPKLAPQLCYEHKNNTSITLQEDGSYLIENHEIDL